MTAADETSYDQSQVPTQQPRLLRMVPTRHGRQDRVTFAGPTTNVALPTRGFGRSRLSAKLFGPGTAKRCAKFGDDKRCVMLNVRDGLSTLSDWPIGTVPLFLISLPGLQLPLRLKPCEELHPRLQLHCSGYCHFIAS